MHYLGPCRTFQELFLCSTTIFRRLLKIQYENCIKFSKHFWKTIFFKSENPISHFPLSSIRTVCLNRGLKWKIIWTLTCKCLSWFISIVSLYLLIDFVRIYAVCGERFNYANFHRWNWFFGGNFNALLPWLDFYKLEIQISYKICSESLKQV